MTATHVLCISYITEHSIDVLPVLVTIPVTSIFVMFICLHIHRTAGSYLGVTKILC